MRLQLGSIYMLSLDSGYMGLVVRRMWTKPWRYKVEALPWDWRDAPKIFIASNLTKEGVIGIFKLLDEPKSRREA